MLQLYPAPQRRLLSLPRRRQLLRGGGECRQFADITRIVSWDAEKLTLTASGELDKADKPAIAEIIASAKDKKIYRVKLHDKTPALALLTRILEKFVKQDEQTDDDGEEARQFLLEELDRLAAEVVAEEGDREVAAGDPVAG